MSHPAGMTDGFYGYRTVISRHGELFSRVVTLKLLLQLYLICFMLLA